MVGLMKFFYVCKVLKLLSHTYDGRYHKACYDSFIIPPKNSANAISSKILIDDAIQSVVDLLNSNKASATWTTAELYNVYTKASGLSELSYSRVHKEEAKSRKELDSQDRSKLLEQLSKYSHPLLTDSDKLFNVVNGQCASEDINVYDALYIGKKQMEEFVNKLPDGFHHVIEKLVKTMQQMKKSVVVQGKPIYNPESHFINLILIGSKET